MLANGGKVDFRSISVEVIDRDTPLKDSSRRGATRNLLVTFDDLVIKFA